MVKLINKFIKKFFNKRDSICINDTNISYSEYRLYTQLEMMKNFGIQGLECYYSRYDMDEIELLAKCAEEKDFFTTGGSDYHGTNKNIPLGRLNANNTPIASEKLTILKAL